MTITTRTTRQAVSEWYFRAFAFRGAQAYVIGRSKIEYGNSGLTVCLKNYRHANGFRFGGGYLMPSVFFVKGDGDTEPTEQVFCNDWY